MYQPERSPEELIREAEEWDRTHEPARYAKRQEEKEHSQKQSRTAGMYYVIPAQVFEDAKLEHSEINFYALLSGLAFNDGYCWASDKYLASRMRVEDRTIRKWILKLEKLGYIRRETERKGLRWERKIFLCH